MQCNHESWHPVRAYEVKGQQGNIVMPKLKDDQYVCHQCMGAQYRVLIIDTYLIDPDRLLEA